MTQLKKGEVWTVGGRAPGQVIVMSGNMFNDLPDYPFVLGMRVRPGRASDSLLTVELLPDECFAVVDTIGRVPKQIFAERVHAAVDVQVLTDLHNRLFKILATN